jgi:hypothetical protein
MYGEDFKRKQEASDIAANWFTIGLAVGLVITTAIFLAA